VDLGGLPLTRLEIKHGADQLRLDFSAPNPQLLSQIDISGGAGSTEITNLANANFSDMTVEGGAAGFGLSFGGVLLRDAHVRVQTSLAGVEISIPRSTAAKITSETGLASVEVGEGFTKEAGMIMNQAALEGKKPTLFIQASVTLGSLGLVAN
jgi:hypothetical protein